MSLYSHTHNLDNEKGVEFLSKVPYFVDLDQDQISQLADLFRSRSFAEGVTIYHQDMPGNVMYLIEEGLVRLFSIGRTGQEVSFRIVGANDIFGETCMLDGKRHTTSAITLKPTTVWMLGREELRFSMQKIPAFSEIMISVLTKRIREANMLIELIAFQDVQGRLAYALLNLASNHGKEAKEGIEIDVELKQVDLASMICVSRESVNKTLALFRTRDLIEINENRLIVLNQEGLHQLYFDRGR